MSTDDQALCAQAVERWHELVRERPASEDDLARLRAIFYSRRRVVGVLRPRFLTRAQYESERLAVALLGGALKKVCAAVLHDPALLDYLRIPDRERDLIAIDPGFEDMDVLDRYDGFVSRSQFGFVEVQGGAPGGVGFQDEAARAFEETWMFQRFAEEFEAEAPPVLPAQLQALLDAWSDWGGEGDPTIAIVDWDDAPLMQEFRLIESYIRDAGHEVFIADPRSLDFDGRRLRRGSTEIDLIYRRLVAQDCLARPDEVKAVLDAARAGAVCVVNPFATDVISHKSIFDLLTDPAQDLGLTDAERDAVANHVPWTRHLVEGADDEGVAVSPEYVAAHRESVVLKPTHDYGGHGVHLGPSYDDASWRKIVADATGHEYLVQQLIEADSDTYPADEPGFPLREYYVDTDPYTFRGRMQGLLTRLSTQQITNITAGGSMTPCFVLEAPR